MATFSLSEVKQHHGLESCWSIIDGFVYDLTSFVHLHPGGVSAEVIRYIFDL